MALSVLSSTAPTLGELQERVNQMQGRPASQPLATHSALAGMLSLRTGATYGVDSASLAMMLMAGPSADGGWCAVVGSAEFGIEAAAATGVELSRTILVPAPADQWLEVTSALIDVVAVVVVKPPQAVTQTQASRISARLRERGAMLISWGDWPRCEAQLSMSDARWVGLGKGHGHLQGRQVTVAVHKGAAPAEHRRLWLPGADRVIRQVEAEPVVIRRVS